MAEAPLPPPTHLGPGRKWTYHAKLTNDPRELFLYTFTSAPTTTTTTTFAVVKRVHPKEANIHTQCGADDNYPHIIHVLARLPLPASATPGIACAAPPTTDVYLVLEHATGGTLEHLLESARPSPDPFPFRPNPSSAHQRAQGGGGGGGGNKTKLPAWFCYHMFAEILDAVLRLHTREGIIHTDLHLKNVMFQKQPPPRPQAQQRLPLPTLPPPELVVNPDEIPLDEEEGEENKDISQPQQQEETPWAVPIVKIIDFGRVHELPPEDEDGASPWEDVPSPCPGLLVRLMLMDGYLFESGFCAFLEPLARGNVSIQVLREARAVAMARKGENVHVPQWLREHFQ